MFSSSTSIDSVGNLLCQISARGESCDMMFVVEECVCVYTCHNVGQTRKGHKNDTQRGEKENTTTKGLQGGLRNWET